MARDPTHIAARVTFKVAGSESGTVSNTFIFQFTGAGSPITSDWVNLCTDVGALYTTGAGSSISAYMGPQFNSGSNQSEVALYSLDMADPHHYFGSPVFVRTWTLSGLFAAQAMPNEVAVALSFRANYGVDPEHSGSLRPRASDRGRVYLGPWSVNAFSDITLPDGTKFPEVKTTLVNAILAQAQNMKTVTLGHSWQWCVWSRREAVLKACDHIAVDPYIDSQRKRGVHPGLQTWVPLT